MPVLNLQFINGNGVRHAAKINAVNLGTRLVWIPKIKLEILTEQADGLFLKLVNGHSVLITKIEALGIELRLLYIGKVKVLTVVFLYEPQ